MKKKIIMFLLAICFLFPCAFMLVACDDGNTDPPAPEFLGYETYIKGEKTNLFECVSGETAITPEDLTIKSCWTDESLNEFVPLSDFNVSVLWSNENCEPQTELPNFWTNGTGDTSSDFATSYTFTITLKTDETYTSIFDVIIHKRAAQNCSVRIFDGESSKDVAEMTWAHNYFETDDSKDFRFDIENIDPEYNKNIEWALIDKDTYDALETAEEKKAYVIDNGSFAEMRNYIRQMPGTYYVFAKVPECNNIVYGEDGNGIIYDYATLTITDREIERVKVNFEYDYGDPEFAMSTIENIGYGKSLFNDFSTNLFDEILNIKRPEWDIDFIFYGFNGTEWSSILSYEQTDTDIKVHAVKENNIYKWVVLKDVSASLTEWVYVNNDGTKSNNVVADNTKIELVDYTQLDYYTNNSQITVPIYYKVLDDSERYGFDYSHMYETDLTIKKKLNDYFPYVKAGTDDHVPNVDNLVEITYGERIQVGYDMVAYDPVEIVSGVFDVYTHEYSLIGCDEVGFTNGPKEAYITTGNPNVAWKVAEGVYNSVPTKVFYQIHKAVVQKPEYKEVSGVTNNAGSYIEVLYDQTCANYKLSNFLTTGNEVDDDYLYDDDEWRVNVYAYELTNDNFDSQEALISTVKEEGRHLWSNDKFVEYDEAVLGKTFVIMYELQNTLDLIWDNRETGTIEPLIFKVKVVDSIK